jgi:5-methylcytosine-specific restriction endonuclease McrA
MVTYDVRPGANTVPIGVKRSNWPYRRTAPNRPGKRFLYTRHDPGDVEKDALKDVFNQRLLPAGETLRRNGFDLDHVHEKQFGGEDAYSNLWPADYQENQLAGTRHDHQLDEYRQTVGAIDGHWFEIVEARRASSEP